MKNLYSFSKDVWFVKLLRWVYAIEPTETFKVFCPIFWLTVLTILFLPIILIIKMFGKSGTKVLQKVESRKRDKEQKEIEALVKRCKEGLSDKEAYDITQSIYWYGALYRIGDELLSEIRSKKWKYEDYLRTLPKKTSFKETKWFSYLSQLVVGLAVTLIIFGLSRIEYMSISWKVLKEIGIALLFVTSLLTVSLILMFYVFPNKYVQAPFKFIGRGFLICCSMFYLTYKKACPRITWKMDE